MSATANIFIYSLGLIIFYTVSLWFVHRASRYFKKLDQNTGNIDTNDESSAPEQEGNDRNEASNTSESITCQIIQHSGSASPEGKNQAEPAEMPDK